MVTGNLLHLFFVIYLFTYLTQAVVQLVEALRYKP
jgi:hypothetical protein